jgi:hypothetical protein
VIVQYENITVLRTNAMKYLPNYFEKGQVKSRTVWQIGSLVPHRSFF